MDATIHLVSGWYWEEHQEFLVGNEVGFQAFAQAIESALVEGNAPAVGYYDRIELVPDAVLFTNYDELNDDGSYTLYGTKAGLILLLEAVEKVLKDHETPINIPPVKGLRLLGDQFFEENPYASRHSNSRFADYFLIGVFFLMLVALLLGCNQIVRWITNLVF